MNLTANSNGNQSKMRYVYSLKGNRSGSDGMSWHAVAQFKRDCTIYMQRGVPFNDTLDDTWQPNNAIKSISFNNFLQLEAHVEIAFLRLFLCGVQLC